MPERFLFDTAVFVYSEGTDHPYREPCRAIVSAATRGIIDGEASVELVQEYIHIKLRRGVAGAEAAADARDVLTMLRPHAVEVEDVTEALNLLARHSSLDARDAIHAATAIRRSIPYIVSPDRAFDDVPGLERLDPSIALDVLVE